MSVLQAAFLGILQGFTELLPVSSSGHLALAERAFGLTIPLGFLGFDVLLHLGSLCALLLCYPRTWVRILGSPFTGDRSFRRLFFLLILVTVPAGLAGVFYGEALDTLRSPFALGIGFLISGLALVLAERASQRRSYNSLRLWETLFIGVAQAIALPPSISRSGMTIAASRFLGLARTDAVDFSFLMAVPAIAGAVVFTGMKVLKGSAALPPLPVSSIGFLASFVASVVAVLTLKILTRRFSTAWFALYLIPLAVILLAL